MTGHVSRLALRSSRAEVGRKSVRILRHVVITPDLRGLREFTFSGAFGDELQLVRIGHDYLRGRKFNPSGPGRSRVTRVRESNSDASAGNLAEIERIIGQIRATRPGVKIILRGDSGFCRKELMGWCEGHGVDYVFGLARNQRLRKIIGQQMWQATEQWNRKGKPARVFAELGYQTRKAKNRG